MIGCDRFIYVHVPKTGGTWVRQVLSTRMPEAWSPFDRYGHVGVVEIPPHLRGVPRIAFVRNPWDWFVSLFAFHGGESPVDFPKYVSQVGYGYYTHLTRPLLVDSSNNISCLIKRYEDGVSSQMASFVEAHGGTAEEVAPIVSALRSEPKANVSSHGHYRDYFDSALAKAVGDANSWSVRRFGYEF